ILKQFLNTDFEEIISSTYFVRLYRKVYIGVSHFLGRLMHRFNDSRCYTKSKWGLVQQKHRPYPVNKGFCLPGDDPLIRYEYISESACIGGTAVHSDVIRLFFQLQPFGTAGHKSHDFLTVTYTCNDSEPVVSLQIGNGCEVTRDCVTAPGLSRLQVEFVESGIVLHRVGQSCSAK